MSKELHPSEQESPLHSSAGNPDSNVNQEATDRLGATVGGIHDVSFPHGDATADPHGQPTRDLANSDQPNNDADPFQQLDVRFITVERMVGWIVTTVLLLGIAIGCAIGLAMTWPPNIWTLVVGIGVLGVVVPMIWSTHVYPTIAYKHCKYRLDERGLEIHRGWIWRSIINVPLSRVQHTDVAQGPFQRKYGIGTLIVYTAGTQHASVELAGLAKDEAERMRNVLVSQGQSDAV